MGGRKWTAGITVQATAIARIPETGSTPQIFWFLFSVAFDVAGARIVP
jgi:hypothetical protein